MHRPQRRARFSTTIQRNKSEDREEKKGEDATALDVIAEIFRNQGNIKGKLKAKDLYDAITRNPMLAPKSSEILSQFNFRLQSEVGLEEVKLCMHRRKTARRHTELRPDVRSEISSSRAMINKPVLKAMFDQYDLDKNGVISLRELKHGMRGKFNDETIEELFHEYDVDGNGVLDFNEFMMLYCPDGTVTNNN